MNSIIICEGSTDSILLQYFLRKAYGWEDTKERIVCCFSRNLHVQ